MHESLALRFLRWLGHQDWIRFGIRSRLIRTVFSPDAVDRPVRIYALNHWYDGNLKNYVDWLAYFFGAQEKQELIFLGSLLGASRDSVVLDIGANVGQFSAYLAHYACEVHAFEPFEPVRREMETRLDDNGILNVRVHPIALGAADEELVFYAPQNINTGTASFVQEHAPNINVPTGTLRVVRGDDYLQAHGVPNASLVKIDVEGFEKQVLIGLSSTLRRSRPIIFMEFSKETQSSFATIEELEDLLPDGYLMYRVVSDRPRAVVLNRAGCQLVEFDFRVYGGNLLLIPSEKGPSIVTDSA